MLADLDDPPRARWRGVVVGILLAAPLVLAIGWALLPLVHRSVRGGAEEFDARLRQEDAYMHAVCQQALSLPRDERLCACALAAEFPSLDCRARFTLWTVERQVEQCAAPLIRRDAPDFCRCVDDVNRAIQAASLQNVAPDHQVRTRQAGAGYVRCTNIVPALYLPGIAELKMVARANRADSATATHDGHDGV